MNRFKIAAISTLISLFTFILVGSVIGVVNGNPGEFIYVVFLLFPPLFVLSLCTSFLFNWLFNNHTKISRMSLAFLISTAIAICYTMISWLMFGDFLAILKESIGILLISILVITITEGLRTTNGKSSL